MATNEDDVLCRIDGLAQQSQDQSGSLRNSLQQLSNRLVESCKGINIHAAGERCTLDECEPVGEYVYGYFFFSADGIAVAYRTTDDDLADSDQRDPYGPSFHVQSVSKCPIDWLTTLIAAGSIRTLVQQIGEQLQQRSAELAGATATIDDLAKNPSSAVGSAFEAAAKELGYEHAVTVWRSAQEAIYMDPPAAITRASSMIETICKHILSELGTPQPQDLSIQSLTKATTKALGLDPSAQVEAELRGICSGLSTVAQNIGALRTKAGDAHGRGPDFVPLDSDHARLAVDAAGTVASFLLQRWNTKKGQAS